MYAYVTFPKRNLMLNPNLFRFLRYLLKWLRYSSFTEPLHNENRIFRQKSQNFASRLRRNHSTPAQTLLGSSTRPLLKSIHQLWSKSEGVVPTDVRDSLVLTPRAFGSALGCSARLLCCAACRLQRCSRLTLSLAHPERRVMAARPLLNTTTGPPRPVQRWG